MLFDAKTENYEVVSVLDQLALFTSARLDRSSIPEGLYAYDVRSDDEGLGCPCVIAPFILVNHWGTILTKEPIEMSDGDCRYLEVVEEDTSDEEEFEDDYILSCEDWNYEGFECSIDEFMKLNKEEDLDVQIQKAEAVGTSQQLPPLEPTKGVVR